MGTLHGGRLNIELLMQNLGQAMPHVESLQIAYNSLVFSHFKIFLKNNHGHFPFLIIFANPE